MKPKPTQYKRRKLEKIFGSNLPRRKSCSRAAKAVELQRNLAGHSKRRKLAKAINRMVLHWIIDDRSQSLVSRTEQLLKEHGI